MGGRGVLFLNYLNGKKTFESYMIKMKTSYYLVSRKNEVISFVKIGIKRFVSQ